MFGKKKEKKETDVFEKLALTKQECIELIQRYLNWNKDGLIEALPDHISDDLDSLIVEAIFTLRVFNRQATMAGLERRPRSEMRILLSENLDEDSPLREILDNCM